MLIVADISFISYDPNTGLIVKTKAEIMASLIEITQQAYGGSYTVDEGTEMYNLLDIIASSITDAGNACQLVYDAFSFITAQGAPLDALVSLAGVTRIPGETDAQLRARYYKFLYTQSTGTVEGLEARVYELQTTQTDVESNFIQNVRVYENYTNTAVTDANIAWSPNGIYTVGAHSILVVVQLRDDYIEAGHFEVSGSGTSQTQTIVQEDATALNNVIENYKSLGCGITLNNMRVGEDTPYYFAIAMNSQLKVTINIYFPNRTDYVNYHAAVENYIKTYVSEYLNGLNIGEDILYSGIMSCVYKAYDALSADDFIFTVGNSSTNQVAGDITVQGYYIGTTNTTSQVTANLYGNSPRVVVPYTAYINTTVDDITVNSTTEN